MPARLDALEKYATVLFDIDGTLLLTGGAGLTAIRRTMIQLFDVSELPEMKVHGRTDYSIVRDLFQLLELPFEQHFSSFRRHYHHHLAEVLEQRGGYVLPGVTSLLHALDQDDRFSVGLLTGNARRAADLKLSSYGIAHYFRYGGFGDYHASRSDVAREAAANAEAELGRRFASDRMIVIGDTTEDVSCARAINAVSLAVATGGTTRDELKAVCASATVDTLAEVSPQSLWDLIV